MKDFRKPAAARRLQPSTASLVHTNFPNTVKRVYAFSLADFDQPANLETLRRLFTDPDALKPGLTA